MKSKPRWGGNSPNHTTHWIGANVSGPLTLKTPSSIPGSCPETWGLTLWDVGANKARELFSHARDKAAWMPRKFCAAFLLDCCPLLTPLTLFLVLTVSCHYSAACITVQTMKLCWTWQPPALVSLHKGAGSCDPHQSFPRYGCGLLFTWYNCQAYCDPSWREPWSSFPWLQGGGCLSSPRPSNGSLGWLRGCHQLLEFLDSTPNSPSQRDWLLVSWVSDLWDSWILQLGRFS